MPRRDSVTSVSSFTEEDAQQSTNWVADVVGKLYLLRDRYTKGEVVKSEEEQRMERITEVIRTYRGIYIDEDSDEKAAKPWVDRPLFDITMSFIIILNMIVIGLEIDNNDENDPGIGWILLEVFFVGVFITEIAVKVYYHKWPWVIYDGINLFTTIIAFSAVINLVLSAAAVNTSGVLRMISMLRVIGLVRLTKIIKKFRALEELRLVILGLVDSFQAIFWVVVLTGVFLYISGVIITAAVGQNLDVYRDYKYLSGGWDHEELFGTIGRSMYTLLTVMTLDSWSSKVARHIVNNQWYMMIFFAIFLLLSAFGLLNVVTAVIVEHTLNIAQSSRSRNKVKEDKKKKQEIENIGLLFERVDVDQSGEVDVEEFMEAVRDPEVIWRLKQLELPVSAAAKLFSTMDGSGARSLTLPEFKDGLSQLKGPAQSRDLLAIQAKSDDLASKVEYLEETLREAERMVNSLDETSMRISRRFGYAVSGCRDSIARRKGGAEPCVPPKRHRIGMQENVDLSLGNRPALPRFPNLLS